MLKVYSIDPNSPFPGGGSKTDSLDNLGGALTEEGFCLKEKNIGMFLRLEDFSSRVSPNTLLSQRVGTLSDLKDFSMVIVFIGGSPLAFDCIYSHLPPSIYAANGTIELYNGYFENRPTVTGVLVTHANVAGIYYVATDPNLRKRGFGTVMMEYLLERARVKGYVIATLQASQEGVRLYERLGFKACCTYLEYAPKKN